MSLQEHDPQQQLLVSPVLWFTICSPGCPCILAQYLCRECEHCVTATIGNRSSEHVGCNHIKGRS